MPTATNGEPGEIPSAQEDPPAVASTDPQPAFSIRAGVLLSRPPLTTRDLTSFEKAFYLYQRRLNERTAMHFPRYFYFQPNTPGDIDWRRKMKERKSAAREIGLYSGYGKDRNQDEVYTGSKQSEPEVQMQALLKDAVIVEEEDDDAKDKDKDKEPVELQSPESETKVEGQIERQVDRPPTRVTAADIARDQRSLNRALSRTLYFVVQDGSGQWRLPSDILSGPESLHRAAERLLVQTAGLNMNTWFVGKAPVGHHVERFDEPAMVSQRKEAIGQKVFFMKSRIFGGKPNLKDNKFGLVDYKWLAKEELEAEVSPQYWKSIRNMLVAL